MRVKRNKQFAHISIIAGKVHHIARLFVLQVWTGSIILGH